MTVFTVMFGVVATVTESVCLYVTTTGLLIFLGIGRREMPWKDYPELYTAKNGKSGNLQMCEVHF